MIRRIIYLLLATIVFGGLAGAIAFYAFDFKPKMIAGIIMGAPRPPVTTPTVTFGKRRPRWRPR